MKVDNKRLEIAMARACMNIDDVVKAADMPRPTVNNAIQGRNIRPATVGRIAKALCVDVTEIIKEE